ncbi:MAG TPA: COX15/CtaA family protein [Gammaproteobacteria bacterium]|nr:COX15/CtaA family protein [Gammaproteobacteria bacterium]
MNVWFVRLARIGAVLALAVVMLGAYVRLSDAGLGCPDWPGCYGRLVVPHPATSAEELGLEYTRPLEHGKAWREMIHRYLASTLGLVCVALAGLAWRNRRDPAQPKIMPAALVALVIFQGLLGMWTVTLLLKPIVVVAHLLGGLATLTLLASLGRWRPARFPSPTPALRALGLGAAAALVLQISLGGWTSANYAALACPDFPTCQTQWWPAVADFKEAFVLWRGIGIDYEGGVLDHPARVAVHFTHRLGALLAAVLIALLGFRLAREPATRADGAAVLAVLALQLSLGVSIVWFGVPLAVAVLHNGVAALLLLAVINANQRIR